MLNGLHVTNFNLWPQRLLRIFRIFFTEDDERCADFEHSIFHIHTKHNGITLAENLDSLKHAGEDSLFTLLDLTLLTYLVHILREEISQVIDYIGCKDLNLVLFCIFLSISKHLHVEHQQTPISV